MKNFTNQDFNETDIRIPALNPSLAECIRESVASSFGHYSKRPDLRTPEPVLIRAGTRGGLPSDSLTTDLFWGCLPASVVCYGNCFAAKAAFSRGYNFGCRVENKLDIDLLREDLAHLPSTQKFVKNGFNSDPSINWEKARDFAGTVTSSGLHLLFITKCLSHPTESILSDLANFGVELKVSISALDLDQPLNTRLSVLTKYQSLGGLAIPNVMTAKYENDDLRDRQDKIVDFLVEHDIPACENPLRLTYGSQVSLLLDQTAIFPVPQNKPNQDDPEMYCGAMYREALPLPPYYSMKSLYAGLPSNRRSELSSEFIESCWEIPIATAEELLEGKITPRSPRMSLILW